MAGLGSGRGGRRLVASLEIAEVISATVVDILLRMLL